MLDLQTVYLRDAATCWLCGLEVPWRNGQALLSPTRDHVVPVRDGGPSTPENLRLAHAWCNNSRETTTQEQRADYIDFLLAVRVEDYEPIWPKSKRSKGIPKGVRQARKRGYLVQYRADGVGGPRIIQRETARILC